MTKAAEVDPGRLLAALKAAVLDGPGALSPERRAAAASAGPLDEPAVAGYVQLVRHAAYRVTDAHIEALRAAGLNDDQIFELTIAASLGAAIHHLDRGLAAIDAAEGE